MRRAIAVGLLLSSVTAPAAGQLSPRASGAERDFATMLEQLEQREKKLAIEVERLGPETATVERRIVARGRAYYRMVRAGLLPVGGGFEELVDHAARLERLRAALARDLETKVRLETRRRDARNELRRVRAERAPLVIQRQAMTRARSAMAQAEERQQAFLRAFGGQSLPLPHTAVYGATSPSSDAAPARFAELRGRMPVPVGGRTEVVHPRGDDQGIFLVVARDAAVRAVYPGRVVYVGPSRHGTTVVLDHGDRFFSVYGKLAHVEVRKGEVVPDRGRIAWVLRYGDQSPMLYFEVRRGDTLLDAARWLGL
ncbi:MAG: peptidoglycan DD-metalloendopeptidase family protein [Myxococcota bacterium]